MKLLSAFLLAFVICAQGSGQEMKKSVLASAGSSGYVYANLKSYYLIQTVGQKSVINTYDVSDHSLRQGFLQPIPSTFLSTTTDHTLQARVFPNPAQAFLQVWFSEPVYDLISIRLFDTHGRELVSQQFLPQERLRLDLSTISPGFYVLKLSIRAQEYVTNIVKR